MIKITCGGRNGIERVLPLDIAALTMAFTIAFEAVETKIRRKAAGWSSRQLDAIRTLRDTATEMEKEYVQEMKEFSKAK